MRPRRFLSIPLSYEYIDQGWVAFYGVEHALRRHGVAAERLKWRYVEANCGGMSAAFEVLDATG